ncbi:Pre-mRNA cleavage complex II protein Clp1-domain-containing protein [Lophiotrema nucula]|uniref:Polynucleotide 5'-hydroxyl-kinase GRC3 n=1 Tax=Lophiotrema nucula TaxID=690887 RepID=A0A6A5ZPC4_9PLEO|nr:Pre-mRNA cleavage complex II protein Clp1-domain-containing protein [Lophiotrema nucula]
MLSLPGLNLTAPPLDPVALASAPAITRTQDLSPNKEFRFEVPFGRTITIKLLSGTAEYFGTEFAPNQLYSFSGTKGAVYSWHGCRLEIGGSGGDVSEYVAEETGMMGYANAHFSLEALRERAAHGIEGPRVLIVGPENSGKTTFTRILTSYAVKSGRQPMVVNLDPRQGMLSVPGSMSAAAFSSIIDVEDGWGSSPISGPSPIPVKMPLVYHYGIGNPELENGKIFKPLVTRMALAVMSRLEEDRMSKQAGLLIDTPGAISAGKGGVYDNIEHIISEFSVNIVFVMGMERLYSDLTRKYSNLPSSDTVNIIRLDSSGGCVQRDEEYMKALRQAQIRAYFFGNNDEVALAPQSQMADFEDLHIFKIKEGQDANALFRAYDDFGSTPDIYERVTPTPELQNSLLAVTTAAANDRQEMIRDASIRGYIYVADVDETKKKVRLLSPQPGQTPPNALILGSFPEDVPGLVS